MAVEPEATTRSFPPAETADEHGVVCAGGDLQPGTILAAYRRGLFPFRLESGGDLYWFSPDPRAVLEHRRLRMVKSARAAARSHHWSIRTDTAFKEVVERCAQREEVWIDEAIIDAYTELHRLGWAHSVEVWEADELVGGLYGLLVGRMWFGESMFSGRPNASKYALSWLAERLDALGSDFQDIQFMSPHMERMGATEISRSDFLRRLAVAVAAPQIEIG